jgi:hypothetical protein
LRIEGALSFGQYMLGTTGAATPVPVTGKIAAIVDDGTFVIENGGSSLDVTSAVAPSSSGYFFLTSRSTLEIAAYLGTSLKMAFIGSSNKPTAGHLDQTPACLSAILCLGDCRLPVAAGGLRGADARRTD